MKLFISVVLLCISTFIGYKKSLEFKKKQKYYKDFIDFNNLLISEMKFGMKTIKQLLFNITAKNCVTESIKEIIFTSDNNIDINFIDESEKKIFN